MKTVPISQKLYLTLEEAAAYTNVGTAKLRRITNENPYMVLYVGSKRLILRKKLEDYLASETSL